MNEFEIRNGISEKQIVLHHRFGRDIATFIELEGRVAGIAHKSGKRTRLKRCSRRGFLGFRLRFATSCLEYRHTAILSSVKS